VQIEYRAGVESQSEVYRFDERGELEEIFFPDVKVRYVRTTTQGKPADGSKRTAA
jgi:hypothetical protein